MEFDRLFVKKRKRFYVLSFENQARQSTSKKEKPNLMKSF